MIDGWTKIMSRFENWGTILVSEFGIEAQFGEIVARFYG